MNGQGKSGESFNAAGSLALYRRLRRRVVEIRRASYDLDYFRADAIQLRLRDRIRKVRRAR